MPPGGAAFRVGGTMCVEAIAKVQEYLTNRFFERDDAIEGMMVALGCRQHVLFLGPPGTAKSEMCVALAGAIEGARYFQWCLGKDSRTDELFGPVSVKALENDQYRRVTAGKLPEAEIAFVDEIFKANTTVLNNMLTVMNERVFHNDGQVVRCPLISLFGASNELPQGEDETHLAAFADRFLLRYEVGYIAEDSHFARMLTLPDVPTQAPHLSIEDVRRYQEAVAAVRVPQEALDMLVVLRRSLREAGFTASDRRWRTALGALKAKAALAGDGQVQVQRDFDILVHILPPTPAERKQVSRILRQVADPLCETLTEILEAAREVTAAALANPTDAGPAIEANRKLKAMIAELQGIAAKTAPGSRARVEKAMQRILEQKQEVVERCLGGTI